MKICFVTKELFAWGKYGGFGWYVRVVGRELAKRGFEVSAVIPRSDDQRPQEFIDGIAVSGLPYPTSLVDSVTSEVVASGCAPYVYAKCGADIYHSINPSFHTLLAMMARPVAKHLIAFRDLRDVHDWRAVVSVPGLSTLPNRIRTLPADAAFMKRIVRQADGLYAKAEFLREKAVRMYGLEKGPPIVRDPYQPPNRRMKKSDHPTVCFLGRLDPIKRPWLFFQLARELPDIEFHVMGRTTVPSSYLPLIKPYGNLGNLKFFGWTFGDFKSRLLERSWVLVNTSIHESCPTSFLEAWGHECAVLCGMDFDGLVEKYGYRVRDGKYKEGLQQLLRDDLWKEKGRGGRRYVETYHDPASNVERLVGIYRAILA